PLEPTPVSALFLRPARPVDVRKLMDPARFLDQRATRRRAGSFGQVESQGRAIGERHVALAGADTPKQPGPFQPVGPLPVKRTGADDMAMLALFAGIGHRANPLPLWQESRCDQIGAELRCRPGQGRAGNLPQPVIAPVQLTAEIGRTVSLGLEQPPFALELEIAGSVGAARLCQEKP